MIAIACVDDGLGVGFNRRRQSRDRAMLARLSEVTRGAPVWMNSSTAKLFDPLPPLARVAEDFLDRAGQGEYCFAENTDLAPLADRLEGLVLYRWNRAYPADRRLGLDPGAFRLVRRTDFPGSSHEKITEEVYTR